MSIAPFIISLPIADRAAAFSFYTRCLELEPVGPVGDDGLPEPLQFELNTGVRLMLVPPGGFERTIGGRRAPAPTEHECLLVLTFADAQEIDAVVDRAVAAGGEIVAAPRSQPWGYSGSFTDLDSHMWMLRAEPAG